MNRRFLIIISVLLVLTVNPCLHIAFVSASNESASVDAANSSINQAYTNVLSAENAGGNVSQLLTSLNVAAELLAQADNALRSGDLTDVSSNADNARLIANQVNSEALSLKSAAISNSQNQFLLTVMFSINAALIYVVILLIVWRRFKRRYNKRLLSMKPEVVNNGA